MDSLPNSPLHRAPSVGAIVKKIMNINPELDAPAIIGLIRRATRTQGERAGEYADTEIVDEPLALELARETLRSGNS